MAPSRVLQTMASSGHIRYRSCEHKLVLEDCEKEMQVLSTLDTLPSRTPAPSNGHHQLHALA
jgi:hypothetical protein